MGAIVTLSIEDYRWPDVCHNKYTEAILNLVETLMSLSEAHDGKL